MAAEVQALQPLQLPSGPSKITPEQRYWRSFRSQQLFPSPNSSPVTHISFPSTAEPSPDSFAVTSGSRVQIFSTRTRKLLKTITRFGVDDHAHSGDIRKDSRVLVAGGDSGTIQVFDTSSRAILKTWKEHRQPVWTTKWSPTDMTRLMSASDDTTVRLWDLSTDTSITTFHGHQDYARSGCFMPAHASNLVVSGSYDQTVRLWDPRQPDKSVMIFKHLAPIETVLPLSSSTAILAAAGNQISVLDLVAARPLELLRSHQKTVTCLSVASQGARVVSGGLDGHVKIHETSGWTIVAASKYSSPILSLSVIPAGPQKEDRHMAVGMQSGVLSLKTRLSGPQKLQQREKAKEMEALVQGNIDEYDRKTQSKLRTQGLQKRLRGLDYDGHGAQLIVQGQDRRKRKKLPAWDRALRGVRYGEALDLAISLSPPDPPTVFTVLTALIHRSALTTALSNRTQDTLAPILRWLTKHITDPRHTLLLTRVSAMALELYAENLGQSPVVDDLIQKLHARVRDVVESAQVAEATRGMLDVVLAGI